MKSLIACFALVLVLAVLVAPASAQNAKVTADRATVRAKPTSASAVVATVTAGAELDVLATEGAWLRVRVTSTGAEGYIAAAFVQQTGAGATPAADSSSVAGSVPVPSGQTTAPPPPPLSSRTFLLRAFGGLWTIAGSTGLQAGGGFSSSPFSRPELELAADFSVIRVESSNAYSGSANVIYNFVLPAGKFIPFAGGGVTVVHTPGQSVAVDVFDTSVLLDVGGSTNAALQLLGGVDMPLNDCRAFRGELRLQFLPYDTSVAILAGISLTLPCRSPAFASPASV